MRWMMMMTSLETCLEMMLTFILGRLGDVLVGWWGGGGGDRWVREKICMKQ